MATGSAFGAAFKYSDSSGTDRVFVVHSAGAGIFEVTLSRIEPKRDPDPTPDTNRWT